MRSAAIGMRFTYRDELCMLCTRFLENTAGRHAES